MKNIILIILGAIGFYSNAQVIKPMEQESIYKSDEVGKNYYYKDINGVLNKFLGNWKYQNGAEIVEIYIFKIANTDYGVFNRDELCIQFKYTKNGVILINTINNNGYNYLISGGRFKNPQNTNQLHFMYLEPGQDFENKHQWLDIEYLSTLNGPQLHWVAFFEAFTIETLAPKMPLNMIFIKQP